MSKHSKIGMQLRKALTVDAPIALVFSAFKRALTEWRDVPGLPDKDGVRLIMEAEIGGRFFALWPTKSGRGQQALLGTVVALNVPEVMRIAGPFTFDSRCIHAVVSFEFSAHGSRTQVAVQHHAIGDIDDAMEQEWSSAWQHFLDDLKSSAEKNKDSGHEYTASSHEYTGLNVSANRPVNSGILASQAMELLDAVATEIRQGHGQDWLAVAKRLSDLADDQFKSSREDPSQCDSSPQSESSSQSESSDALVDVTSDDPQFLLEQAYQNLQCQLIKVRQAVAHAIAAEKFVEQQLQKNRDQASTWLKRADMASEQKNEDLADQARQRMKQYEQAAQALEEQLNEQRETTPTLRQKLTDLEGKVQEAYVRKQVLIARDKAAHATIIANQVLAKISPDATLSAIGELEKIVIASEATAAASASNSVAEIEMPPNQYLNETIATLERTIEAVSKLERMVAKTESRNTVEPECDEPN
jgi:phage shock protein A